MDSFLSRLLDASLQGVIAFVAVLLIVNLFRGLSPTAKGWLWRLCGLKFLVAFAFIVGIPLLPGGDEPVTPSPIPSFPTEEFVAQTTKATIISQPLSTTYPNWTYLFTVLWGTGATVLMAIRVVKELKARSQIFRQATSVALDTPGRFFVSPNVHSPLVVGVIRPSIVLPSEIIEQSDELAMAIAHEQAHIRRHDVSWQAVLNLTACLFWFLPPVHWISTFARGEAESACDQAVLNSTGKTPGQYARFLVRLAKRSPTITTLGMAAQTRYQLSRRILAMNNRPRTRRAVLAAIAILSLPALIPWQAVAQASGIQLRNSPRLDKLARQYLFLPNTEKELGISPEQQIKFDEHGAKSGREWREFGQKLEDLKKQGVSDKDRLNYDRGIRMPMYERNLNERWSLLTPSQQNRQRQLTLQYFGPMILGNADVAKMVNLPEASRSRIHEISLKYEAFMETQSDAQRYWTKSQLWARETKIRDFTAGEIRRMAEINRAIYTAEGKSRNELWAEYYEIRRRGVKIEAREYDNEAYGKQLAQLSKALMMERREQFAKLSAQADALIPLSSQKKWQDIQGKLFKFEPWEIEGQAVISYR